MHSRVSSALRAALSENDGAIEALLELTTNNIACAGQRLDVRIARKAFKNPNYSLRRPSGKERLWIASLLRGEPKVTCEHNHGSYMRTTTAGLGWYSQF